MLDQKQRDTLAAAILPPTAASLSFCSTLAVGQAAGRVLRVSCATPLLGSMLGGLAVAAASVAAAQVSFTVRGMWEHNSKKQKQKFISTESVWFHAMFGLIAFKVLGGSCQNMMPSNVIHPGAWARASIPARGSKYANETEANLIKDLFKQYGCHHCGTRHGQSIADHMPPNAILKQSQARKFQRLLRNLNQLFVKKQPIMQRLFPQCSSCMKLQSAALRHGKSTFVFHFQQGIPQPPYWTGFCIGALGAFLEGQSMV
ncbi:hypothetical protein CY35_04G037600 [Sphagnum magellanicum]|nr:hypothetical protein CY35_04G037600 [Sphagnum magellanicum]